MQLSILMKQPLAYEEILSTDFTCWLGRYLL